MQDVLWYRNDRDENDEAITYRIWTHHNVTRRTERSVYTKPIYSGEGPVELSREALETKGKAKPQREGYSYFYTAKGKARQQAKDIAKGIESRELDPELNPIQPWSKSGPLSN